MLRSAGTFKSITTLKKMRSTAIKQIKNRSVTSTKPCMIIFTKPKNNNISTQEEVVIDKAKSKPRLSIVSKILSMYLFPELFAKKTKSKWRRS